MIFAYKKFALMKKGKVLIAGDGSIKNSKAVGSFAIF
jgi:hypothetical protein